MKQVWILYFCLTLSPGVFSQVTVNEQCKTAYQDILALKFDTAKYSLALEKTTNPENLFVPYLKNYIDFLTVFIGENESRFNELEKNKSIRIDLINKLSDTSRYKKYMLGNIHLQWAVAGLKFKEYFTAAIEINKAYRLLEKNEELFPEFLPNKISLGVLHIMIGMVPEKYQWVLNIISMKGSVVQGREELTLVLEQSNQNEIYGYLKTETLFYLGFVDLNINPDPKQLQFLLEELEPNRKNNLLLTYLTITVLMRTGQNDSALKVLDEKMESDDFYPFYYLDYLRGECHLRKLNTESANRAYTFFLNRFKGRNHIKDAWRKKGWAYLFGQDTVNYLSCLEKVIDVGTDDVDIDKEALREAESGIIPNVELLKSRLLFDGGYYRKSDSILTKMDTCNLQMEEKVERVYRLGRSAHQQGKTRDAISFYKTTIINGEFIDRYFAGNSALKLGEIYENKKGFSKALFYYRLCLDLDFKEYENSIHSKAKAGIERVENE